MVLTTGKPPVVRSCGALEALQGMEEQQVVGGCVCGTELIGNNRDPFLL